MENKQRKYSVKEVAIILLTMVVFVLFFGAEGLYNWAQSFEASDRRDAAIILTKPVYTFAETIGTTAPKKYLQTMFDELRGGAKAAGFRAAQSNDSTSYKDTTVVEDTLEVEQPIKFVEGTKLEVLLIGDSMMGRGLGSAIDKYFSKDTLLNVRRYSMLSSGLTRPDYFDWFAQTEELTSEKRYDIVVISFGANDAQAVNIDGRRQRFGNKKWMELYESRIRRLLNILKNKSGVVYYVGLPPMRESGYHGRMQKLTNAYKTILDEYINMYYFPTEGVVGDSLKKYTSFKQVNGKRKRIRVGDGIHFTKAGGTLVGEALYDKIKEELFIPLEINADELKPLGLLTIFESLKDLHNKIIRIDEIKTPTKRQSEGKDKE